MSENLKRAGHVGPILVGVSGGQPPEDLHRLLGYRQGLGRATQSQ